MPSWGQTYRASPQLFNRPVHGGRRSDCVNPVFNRRQSVDGEATIPARNPVPVHGAACAVTLGAASTSRDLGDSPGVTLGASDSSRPSRGSRLSSARLADSTCEPTPRLHCPERTVPAPVPGPAPVPNMLVGSRSRRSSEATRGSRRSRRIWRADRPTARAASFPRGSRSRGQRTSDR